MYYALPFGGRHCLHVAYPTLDQETGRLRFPGLNLLNFRFPCLPRVPRQSPTGILGRCGRRHPNLPMRQKTGRKYEIPRYIQVHPQPPCSQHKKADGSESQDAGRQARDTAVLPPATRDCGTAPEANSNLHSGVSNHHNVQMAHRVIPVQGNRTTTFAKSD